MFSKPKPGQVVKYVLLALICLLVGYSISNIQANSKYNQLLDSYESNLEEAEVVRNKNRTLTSALTDLETENQDLKSLIVELEARPPQIKYITKTETIIKPTDPVIITPDLPDEYLFTLKPELVVGRFSKEGEQYKFETYDLSFRNLMVISDKKTSASLQLSTSYDYKWQEIPINVEVADIRKQPFWEPHVGVGITAGVPAFEVMGSIWVSTAHPWKNTDLLAARISVNNRVAAFGIDPVGYNIGEPLPVLTDLWLWAGPSINTKGQFGIDITLGSKF